MTDNPIPFAIPGKHRILTKEEIAAEYGERATRKIPEGYRKTRSIHTQHFRQSMSRFTCCRVFDTGKREFVSAHQTWDEAEKASGRMRDLMTDDECAKDYTYLPIERKRGRK